MIKKNILSVVIPVHNAEKHIAECLNSVLRSSFSDFTVILIENGSEDSTLQILETFANKDSRISLFSLKENSLIKAMNFGIEKAQTKYVAIMDSDDICPYDRFEKQIKYLENKKDVVLVGTSVYYFVNKKKKWFMKLNSNNSRILKGIKNVQQTIFNPTIMFKKDIAKKVNYYLFDDYPVPDLAFFLRMSKFGKISNLTEIYQGIRLSENSFTANNFSNIIDKQIEIINRNYNKIKLNSFVRKKIFLSKLFYRKTVISYLTNKYFLFIYYAMLTFILQPSSSLSYLKNKLVLKYK